MAVSPAESKLAVPAKFGHLLEIQVLGKKQTTTLKEVLRHASPLLRNLLGLIMVLNKKELIFLDAAIRHLFCSVQPRIPPVEGLVSLTRSWTVLLVEVLWRSRVD